MKEDWKNRVNNKSNQKWKKIILVLAFAFTTNLIFTACKSENKEQITSDKKEVAVKDVYQCPMKCEKEKTYDKEGKCPVCEMKLRKKDIKKEE